MERIGCGKSRKSRVVVPAESADTNPTCRQCGNLIERPVYIYKHPNGKTYNTPLSIRNWLRRKTCSRACQYKYFVGAKNPNYRGIMPKCIDCGVIAVSGYLKSHKDRKNIRCMACWKAFAKETDYYRHTPQLQKIISLSKSK